MKWLFGRKKTIDSYAVVFCDKPDLNTKFGVYTYSLKDYDSAIRLITMGWPHAWKVSEGCYKLHSGEYIMIEHVLTQTQLDVIRSMCNCGYYSIWRQLLLVINKFLT